MLLVSREIGTSLPRGAFTVTFELALTAEAGAVRPSDDDGTHWRCPALQRLP